MPARTVKKTASFEEELQKLEAMATQMEQSELPLEELMKLYEQGVALTAELKKRLEGRCSETEEEVQTRLKRLDYELSKASEYDYILVNDDLTSTVDKLEKIYLSLLAKKNEN